MFERRPRVKGRILMLPVADIAPSPWQPRRVFDDAELDSLARSIAQNGLLVPIAVRSTPEGYLLIAGERRLMACKRLGLSEIAAIVEDVDEQASAVLSLIENLHRQGLNCFEEAEGIKNLLISTGYTQAAVCAMIDMPQPTVANKLRLLKLPLAVRQELLINGLGERVARCLLRFGDDEPMQQKAVQQIAARKMTAAAAERYIDALVSPIPPEHRARAILRDYRFL
ncbi:MAG: ParB/RepB/Spo0J family partition protein, partial [Angelakisella sp.]